MSVVRYSVHTALNLAALPPAAACVAAAGAIYTSVGIVATALSILTLGKNRAINNVAMWTVNSLYILPKPYEAIAAVVNPTVKMPEIDDNTEIMGVITKRIACPIFEAAKRSASSSNFFTRHVVSRGAFALGAVAAAVTRSADLALGLIAALFSIVPCLARVDRVSHFAFRHLMALVVINDISVALRGVVNPQQLI